MGIALIVIMGRDWRVDTLRGYFLVAMTLGHFANPLAPFTEYTFGYASAPDGFVFLSGLVSAWVYLPWREKCGHPAMVSKIFRRAGTIYLTHFALLVVGIMVALVGGVARDAHPLQTFVSGALLLNQAGFDRILPMYCVFLVFSPIVLKQFTEGRAWLIGGISAALWGGAQFGLGDPSGAGHAAFNFNLCAWQAYFFAGQYLGYRAVSSQSPAPAKSRLLLAACIVVSFALMADRHLALWGLRPFLGFSGHPDHNPYRFLDTACLAYLISSIPRAVDVAAVKLRFFRLLNLLGGHSLQVFAFSLLITRFEAHAITAFSPAARLTAALLTVVSLALPAWLHQLLRDRLTQGHDAIPWPVPRSASAPSQVIPITAR